LGKKNRFVSKEKHSPVPFSALSSFKSVIFDLDGVIVDSEMVHPRTFESALAKYGVKISDHHWKRVYTGIGSYAIFDDLVKKHGIAEDALALVRKRNAIYLREIRKNKLPTIRGFPGFYKLLVNNNVEVVVASGGHANHVKESLRSAGMAHVPFVAIENVKRGKPSPEIFLLAAKRLGVKPSECIVFEDSLAGMEAASRAGMPCVALCTTMPARELKGRAGLIINDFRAARLKRLIALLLERKEIAKKPGDNLAMPVKRAASGAGKEARVSSRQKARIRLVKKGARR
jgi:beta-phosphoglucomutase